MNSSRLILQEVHCNLFDNRNYIQPHSISNRSDLVIWVFRFVFCSQIRSINISPRPDLCKLLDIALETKSVIKAMCSFQSTWIFQTIRFDSGLLTYGRSSNQVSMVKSSWIASSLSTLIYSMYSSSQLDPLQKLFLILYPFIYFLSPMYCLKKS
jgi:hypothetical protein